MKLGRMFFLIKTDYLALNPQKDFFHKIFFSLTNLSKITKKSLSCDRKEGFFMEKEKSKNNFS